MTEEHTGTLQSPGQADKGHPYVVIDGTRLEVPEYVLDWMANMKNPLRNGETVLYKKQQDREGGAWRLTKIRRPDKGSTPAAGPQVDQKSGILLSHYATGCTVRMANGDKTYALKNPFPKDIILPQKIEFTVDKQGFILGHRFYGKADVALQENIDRLNGPADGETVEPPGGELVKAPPPKEPPKVSPKESPKAREEKTTARPTSQPAPDNIGMCTLTIGGTINLQNYENLKVEISGPAAYRREMIEYLKDTLDLFGKKEPTTGGMIDAWKNRVLGGVGE